MFLTSIPYIKERSRAKNFAVDSGVEGTKPICPGNILTQGLSRQGFTATNNCRPAEQTKPIGTQFAQKAVLCRAGHFSQGENFSEIFYMPGLSLRTFAGNGRKKFLELQVLPAMDRNKAALFALEYDLVLKARGIGRPGDSWQGVDYVGRRPRYYRRH